MYTALYMAATRTQIYLTLEQRARLDELIARDGRALAELIRDAVDLYLDSTAPDPAAALDRTFAAAPAFTVPAREEWSRREPDA